jgi:hypothetical protein
MPPSIRSFLAVFAAVPLFVPFSSAFQSPLSEQAVREAYFLGQRHDGTYPRLLGKYMRILPQPKTGPYISSVTLSTPFLQMVADADRYVGNYSAQQAQIDYRKKGEEIVEILVEIQLTDSYGQMIAVRANSASDSSTTFIPRPHDFWKDFEVRIYNGSQLLTPADSNGRANSRCGRRGPCVLIGATLQFDLPASDFNSDPTARIVVTPPEGDSVSVDFDLSSLR